MVEYDTGDSDGKERYDELQRRALLSGDNADQPMGMLERKYGNDDEWGNNNG